ncbi:MAG: hypothetical protein M1812_005910 [Candelaria pacifica]|nr:MAG: hypothetical protein M1812_005910 [Candelaria pacifica]
MPGTKNDEEVAENVATKPISERDILQIWEWNCTAPPGVEACLHDLIAQNPSKDLAVDARDGKLTYGELEHASVLSKTKWAIVAVLATLKAGGACVLLDPSLPLNRANAIMDEIDAKIIVVSTSAAHLFETRKIKLVEVPGTNPSEARNPRSKLPKVLPQNAAVVLFSSGSTGKQKGIIQEHSATCTSSHAWAKMLGINNSSRMLQHGAFGYTVSVMDIFASLVAGGCLCMGSEEDGINDLPGNIRSMEISCVFLSPSSTSSVENEDFPTLTTLSLGGEPMTKGPIQSWAAKLKLINLYGSAEAFGCIAGVVNQERPTTIGRAMASVIWIVDPQDHNRLMPIKEEGEILSESHCLARGYLDNSEKTRQAFVEDPDWLQRGSASCEGRSGRLYKTQDLGQYNSDGTIKYVGRKGTLTKLGAEVVWLGEVEYHLRIHFTRATAAELIVPRQQRETILVCFVALNNDKEGISQSDPTLVELAKGLNAHLSPHLPSYMIPTGFVALGHLPMTMTGKLDRMRLRKIGSGMLLSELTDFDALSLIDSEKDAS